ncbi:MAG: bifunctional riboflavin kinase/FAD synthetase [Clostridia bacterium]|nr:bifunctional riboflavin kinase/FAD synthetase [Clostridia bacterium]
MSEQKRVIALGFFDGVHVGHAELLEMTKRRAAETGGIPTVLTFDVHPDNLVKGFNVPLLTSPEGRVDTIRRYFGIDSVIFIHFNQTLMHMPWRIFLDALATELNACHFVVGHDFCFGWKGEGTPERLKEYCEENGMGFDVIPAVKLDGVTVSSTLIRSLISEGEIARANRLLGHPHSLIDTVGYGYQLGMKIGTPTINMKFADGVLVPRYGVYATKVFLENGSEDEHIAVTNIGIRPTVAGEEKVSVESYILDFSGNLYDHRVRVEFHEFLRPENKFSSISELKAQIMRDADSAREYFENLQQKK